MTIQQTICRTLVLVSCVSCLCIAIGCSEPAGEAVDWFESFDGNSFDRSHWRIAKLNPSVGTVEVVNDALSIVAPPMKEPRPQIRNSGKFALLGDFEVGMDFELITPLPKPAQDYINLELILDGTDGSVYFGRVHHPDAGNGCVMYFAPRDESRESVWKHMPTTAKSGRLKATRIGDVVDCVFVDGETRTTTTVSSVALGNGPVHTTSIALSVAAATTKPIQVRVDNLEAHSHPESTGSMFATWMLAVGVLLVVCLATVWGLKIGRLDRFKRLLLRRNGDTTL